MKIIQLFDQLCREYAYAKELEPFKNEIISQYQLKEISQPSPPVNYNYRIDPSEELNYKVKYGFITLGWFKV